MIALSVLPAVEEHTDDSDDDRNNKQKRNNLDHAVDCVRIGDNVVSCGGDQIGRNHRHSDANYDDDTDE